MRTIDEDIAANTFKNIYLLYGDEHYLKKQYKDKLLKALVADGDTMNFAKYEGKETSIGEVIDLAETLPFFAERRVIYLADTGFFASSQEDLADYLSAVQETTCLVFLEDNVDKRSKTYKAANKYGKAIEFTMPDQKMLTSWMMARIKAAGKSITRSAWDEFLLRTGESMENMDKEMEKLLSYVYDKDAIAIEDVEAICIKQVQTKVFDMISAMAAKNPTKVLLLYHDLLAAKEPPLLILNLIERQFDQMLIVRDYMDQGLNQSQIVAKTAMRDFVVRNTMGLCRNYSLEQLKTALEDAINCEERAKSGLMNEQMAVELLMMQYSK